MKDEVSNETLIRDVKKRLESSKITLAKAVTLVCNKHGVHDRYRRKFVENSVSTEIGKPVPKQTNKKYYWQEGSLA